MDGRARIDGARGHNRFAPIAFIAALTLLGSVAAPSVAAVEAGAQDYDLRLEKGVELFSQRKYAEAAVFFANLTRADPGRKEAFLWLGQAYGKQDLWGQAREPLRRYYALAPSDPEGSRELARGYEAEGNRDLAKLWYKRALDADPNDAESKQAVARLDTASPTPTAAPSKAAATENVTVRPVSTPTGFWHTGLAGVTGARGVWWGRAILLFFFITGMFQGVARVPHLRRTNPLMPSWLFVVTAIAGGAFWYVVIWGIPTAWSWLWLIGFVLLQTIGVSGALKSAGPGSRSGSW